MALITSEPEANQESNTLQPNSPFFVIELKQKAAKPGRTEHPIAQYLRGIRRLELYEVRTEFLS